MAEDDEKARKARAEQVRRELAQAAGDDVIDDDPQMKAGESPLHYLRRRELAMKKKRQAETPEDAS